MGRHRRELFWRAECARSLTTFKNPLLDPIFVGLRESSGQRVISREGAVLSTFQDACSAAVCVAILTDLTSPGAIANGSDRLFRFENKCDAGARLGSTAEPAPSIINVHCEPLPGGRYRVHVSPRDRIRPVAASAQQIAQACWDRFEPDRPQKSGALDVDVQALAISAREPRTRTAYPFYANVSPALRKSAWPRGGPE